MTTVKRITIAAVALLLVLMCSLASCSHEKKQGAFEMLSTMTETTEECQKYRIIYSSNASAELIQSIAELRDSIQQLTGAVCGMTDDTETIYESVPTYYIYLGNIAPVRSYFDGYFADDYLFCALENYAVIGGITDTACISAIERFKTDVLNVYDAQSIFTPGENDFSYRHDSSKVQFLLCGMDITFYETVCTEPRGSDFGNIAEEIYTELSEKYGLYKNMRFTFSESDSYEIIFRMDTSKADACISYNGEDLIISAPDAYGLKLAALEFMSYMHDAEALGKLDVGEAIVIKYSVPVHTFGVILSDFENTFDVLANSKKLIKNARQSQAPVIFFNSVEPTTWEIVRSDLIGNSSKDSYRFFEYTLLDGTLAACAYRPSIAQCSDFSVTETDNFVSLALNMKNMSDSDGLALTAVWEKNGTAGGEAEDELEHLGKSDLLLFVRAENSEHEKCGSLYCEKIALLNSQITVCLDASIKNTELTDSLLAGENECVSLLLSIRQILPN